MPEHASITPKVDVCQGATIELYGRMETPPTNRNEWVGARITAATRCTQCGGPFLAGHAITADLAPNMAGTAHHTDCDDPTLERHA